MSMSRRGHLAVLALFILAASASARAETLVCNDINGLPADGLGRRAINSQGIYCLTADVNLALPTGAAITVNTNNVVIDLNGHKIGNLSAGAGTVAYGIQAADRQNITIKNGTLRGFLTAILLDAPSGFTASQGHVIDGVRVDQNWMEGIHVAGRGCLIQNNQIVATGGTTVFGPDGAGWGIGLLGPGHRVVNNDIMTVTKLGTGTSKGIWVLNATDALVVNNRVTDSDWGVVYDASTGKIRDNLTFNTPAPYVAVNGFGYSDAGNNH